MTVGVNAWDGVRVDFKRYKESLILLHKTVHADKFHNKQPILSYLRQLNVFCLFAVCKVYNSAYSKWLSTDCCSLLTSSVMIYDAA